MSNEKLCSHSYLKTLNKTSCYGCRACEEVCPKKCISMVEDEETFLYPDVNKNECINCGKCLKVCPYDKNVIDIQPRQLKKIFSCIHIDDEIVKRSASGGAFWAIVQAFCNENFSVYGVCYDENLNVVHDVAHTVEDCEKFQKSKYVQSNTNNCYSKIENDLKLEKNVLFTGTPCQCAALKLFLNKEYGNLLIVDVICHGVPSQKLFDKYVQENNVKEFTFKNKKPINNKVNSRTAYIKYNDNSINLENVDSNSFLMAYYTRLDYRPSCGNCKFASNDRVSDITIADSWGIEKYYPELDPLKGVSLVVVNSDCGECHINRIKKYLKIYPVDFNFAVQENSAFTVPTSFHKYRHKFFKYIHTHTFKYSVKHSRDIFALYASKKIIYYGKCTVKKTKDIFHKFIKF